MSSAATDNNLSIIRVLNHPRYVPGRPGDLLMHFYRSFGQSDLNCCRSYTWQN